jgi:hypothetical protein
LKNNRKQDIAYILAYAIEINHWHIYARNEILKIELEIISNNTDRNWLNLFNYENYSCIKIQSCYRLYKTQIFWDEIKQKQLFICKRHHQYIDVGNKMYDKYWFLLKKHLIKQWKLYIENYKYLKFISSRFIQTLYRGYCKYKLYKLHKQNIYVLNQSYILVCENTNDYNRSRYFKYWYYIYIEMLKHKYSDLIVNVLYMNGYSQILRKGKL